MSEIEGKFALTNFQAKLAHLFIFFEIPINDNHIIIRNKMFQLEENNLCMCEMQTNNSQ